MDRLSQGLHNMDAGQNITLNRSPKTVAIYVMANFSPFHISVPVMAFGAAMPDKTYYKPILFSEKIGIIEGQDTFSIKVDHDLKSLDDADIIVIPYWPDPQQPISSALKTRLNNEARKNKTILGLCLGTYVLAFSGLLKGKKAATHWAYEKQFAEQFPDTEVDFNALYVEDGNIITSAGTAAGIDCCLHLIRKNYGGVVANHAARMIVTPPHREGGQAQYLATPVPISTSDQRINSLLETIRKNLASSYSLDAMAKTVGMSRRTFTRRFHQATGRSPMEWLTHERLHFSRHALETTKLSVEEIAQLAGFVSTQSFRRSFIEAFQVTPTKWRQTFSI